MSTQLSDILQLSVAERIQLVADIWDSIAAAPEALPLTDGERAELDRRLINLQPVATGVSWNELKKRIASS